MEVTVIKTSCDSCGTQVPIQEIRWNSAHTEALCADCYDSLAKAPETQQTVIPVPIYVFYDTEGSVLHVSADLNSPDRWKQQGENWWGYKISWVAVKHFDGMEQAWAAVKALQRKLAPKYGENPSEDDEKPETEEFEVFDLEISEETAAPRVVLSVRVSQAVADGIDRMAKHDKKNRTEFLRSLVYDSVYSDSIRNPRG